MGLLQAARFARSHEADDDDDDDPDRVNWEQLFRTGEFAIFLRAPATILLRRQPADGNLKLCAVSIADSIRDGSWRLWRGREHTLWV